MIIKEDFKKVFKSTTREGILNQFYFEHMYLRELLKQSFEREKLINKILTLSNFFVIIKLHRIMQERRATYDFRV